MTSTLNSELTKARIWEIARQAIPNIVISDIERFARAIEAEVRNSAPNEPVQALPELPRIKPWQERTESRDIRLPVFDAMRAEIAELRAAIASCRAQAWLSVDDERKPGLGEVVLLYVRTQTRGWLDEVPCYGEGAQIELGEYRRGESDEMSYFDCYASPISDNDWITHWMPLPPPPASSQPAGAAKGGMCSESNDSFSERVASSKGEGK